MSICEITMDDLLTSYDWEEVFGEGNGGNCDGVIQVVPPGASVSSDGVKRTDVAEIIAAVNGENDEADWIGVFLLNDGRYLVAEGGCDYTGWDCQASNSLCVAGSLQDAIKFGLNPEQQQRLGLPTKGTNPMTTDAPGLREAAEKYSDPSFLAEIRAHADHLGAKHRLPATRQVIVDLVDAVDGFAQHYLATHPSDGWEVISEEWLTSIGGDFDGTGGFDEWIFAARGTTKVSVDRWTDGTWRVFAFCEAVSVLLGNVTTRDDLRHLLAALGCGVQQTTKWGVTSTTTN